MASLQRRFQFGVSACLRVVRIVGFVAVSDCVLPEVSMMQPADDSARAHSDRSGPHSQPVDGGDNVISVDTGQAGDPAQDSSAASTRTATNGSLDGGNSTQGSGAESGMPKSAVGGTGDAAMLDAGVTRAPEQRVEGGMVGISADHSFANWLVADTIVGAKATPSLKLEGSSVRDNVTGLLWQRGSRRSYAGCSGADGQSEDRCTWMEAMQYCESLSLDGMGWRLPTKIELESIMDLTRSAPALDTSLFDAPATNATLWSATSDALNGGNAWTLNLFDGSSEISTKGKLQDVLCVR